jgi:hydroxymethylbilane synthase
LDGLIRIGSRKSILARTQAYLVGSALAKNNPELKISYHFKESSGDKDLQTPLSKMPKKGIFTIF